MMLETTPARALMLVVFIPPPVPLGEAPITIAMIRTNSALQGRFPNGTVLKPAVVDADITWKNALNSVVLFPAIYKNVPAVAIKNVIVKITFVVKVISLL